VARRAAGNAAGTVEVQSKGKVGVNAQRGIEMLFRLGKEVKPSYFAVNAWYESPDVGEVTGRDRVTKAWQLRPTRTIDRVCDGKIAAGCTWTQLDGRRGVSYIRFDEYGKVNYIREVPEPKLLKFDKNSLEAMAPALGLVNGINKVWSWAPGYLANLDPEAEQQVEGRAQPKTRRAKDVVKYLWQEAQWSGQFSVSNIMREYSEDCVVEDMTLKDEKFAIGFDAVKKYQEEMKQNAPQNLRWNLDELSNGDKACTAVWHIYFAGQKKRGLSFYELDEAGKVRYVRICYDPTKF